MRVKIISSEIKANRAPILLLISAISITFFLFYIDEGYYDLRWMNNLGNWIVFCLYAMILWTMALTGYEFKKYKPGDRIIYSILFETLMVVLFILCTYFI